MRVRGLAWGPDDSHHVTISETGNGPSVVVSDLTLSTHSVGLGQPFESTVFVFNKTQETINKAIGVFFGVYDPTTEDFDDHFGWAAPSVDIPPGTSGWILLCTGVELGLWDALACVGTTSGSTFYPDHCLGFQDILSVY